MIFGSPAQRLPSSLPDPHHKHDDRLHEVHAGVRISILKGIHAGKDKRRHNTGDRELFDRHISSDRAGA